jgi:hypothetical protein
VNNQRGPLIGDPAENDAGETLRVHDGRSFGAIGHGFFVTESGITRKLDSNHPPDWYGRGGGQNQIAASGPHFLLGKKKVAATFVLDAFPRDPKISSLASDLRRVALVDATNMGQPQEERRRR